MPNANKNKLATLNTFSNADTFKLVATLKFNTMKNENRRLIKTRYNASADPED
jgi:hypothetical protein